MLDAVASVWSRLLPLSRKTGLAGARADILARAGVTVALDGGARDGGYAGLLRGAGYTGRIVSFEPSSYVFARLAARAAADGRWDAVQTALGALDGEAVLNVSANLASSSLLPLTARCREHPQCAYVARETVSVARIDTLWPRWVQPQDRVFLKLDVQGFESQVLDGCGRRLVDLVAIELEVSYVALYRGQTLAGALLRRLRRAGFRLLALEDEFDDLASLRPLQGNALLSRSG